MKLVVTYLESFKREGSPEVGMGILRVLFNDLAEVFNRLFMVFYHLICLCPFVNVPDVTWDHFNTLQY